MPKQLLVTVFALVGLALAGIAAPVAQGAAAQYPDLKTQPPRDLRFDTVDFSQLKGGSDSGLTGTHRVLRFSNSVWNAGEGALVVRGDIDPNSRTGPAYQRVFDSAGDLVEERSAGSFYWHASHDHYHYEQWGIYQLWTKQAYDAWLAGGEQGPAEQTGAKTTSCMLDEEFMRDIPGTRATPTYDLNGCYPPHGQDLMEGLSVGWADTYDWYRPDQWIVVGNNLADGEYVLRSVVDPTGQVKESANNDPARESRSSNAAIRRFRIQNGAIQDSDPPDGTVTINGVATSTQTPAVKLQVIGRDDVSGPNGVRVSNSGAPGTFVEMGFTDWGSTPNEISWNLANTAAGGNSTLGTKTVYVQLRDGSGKWGPTITDTINLQASSTATAYSNTVRNDSAAAHWKLDESATQTVAQEEIADADGYYSQWNGSPPAAAGGAARGQPSLLGATGELRSAKFDGVNDYIYGAPPSGLPATGQVTLESWIKADTLPIGSERSIFNKPGSYNLRVDGTAVEFQTGSGVVATPAGTLEAGRTYHVVATYDGTTQRIYVDGVQKSSRAQTGTLAAGNQDVYIATRDEGGGYFPGTLDEPAVYATALSPTRVLAHYDAGRAPPQAPAMPSNFTATPLSSSRVRLNWTDNANNENAYVIERSTTPNDWTNAHPLGASQDETSYLDITLTPGTTYYYRIRARNNAGLSNWSTPAQATTNQAPTAVTGGANPVGTTSATIAGTVNPRGASTDWYFEWGTSTSYGNREPATTTPNAGSGTTNVAVSRPLSGLQANTTYHYRLVAQSDDTVVQGSNGTFTTAPGAPAVPGGLSASATSGSAITVSWNDVSGETSYVLERSTDSTFASGVSSLSLNANDTSESIGGLVADTNYFFRIRAANGADSSAWSTPVAARTHGAPVVTVAAPDNVTRTGATLKGTLDPRGASTNWRFDYRVTGASTWSSTTSRTASASGAVSEPVSNLQPNKAYEYKLVATNSVGTREAGGTFTTAPDPAPGTPTGVAASPTSGTAINVSWTNATGETDYELQRSTSDSFPVGASTVSAFPAADATSAGIGSLANDTTYYFRIRARNANGGGNSPWSSTVSARTYGAPVAATSAADSVGRTTATLKGTVDPRGASTSWRFDYRANGTTDWTVGGSGNAGSARGAVDVSAPLTGLSASTVYQYRLVATNSVGTDETAVGSFTTLPNPPATPTLTVAPASGSAIDVTWNNVSGETGYLLQHSTNPNFTSGVTETTRPADATSARVSGLTANTTYHFRILARNAGGDSDWSTAKPAKTHGSPVVTATHDGVKSSSATLKGTIDPQGGATEYQFDYRPSGSATWTSTTPKTVASSGPVSEPVSGLQANTSYEYRLVAENSAGTGQATGAFTTLPNAPAAPTLRAEPVSGSEIDLTWNDVSGETSYVLQRSTDPTFATGVTPTSLAAGDTAETITGLTANTTYHFRILARNAGGDSSWSVASATTHGPPAVTSTHENVTWTKATLKGTVDPHGAATTYRFDYRVDGTATWINGTARDAGSGRGATAVSDAIAGLTPKRTYEYRLIAWNALATREATGSFETPAEPPPVPVTGDASSIGTSAATLAGTVDANGFATVYWFEYGTTTAYGSYAPGPGPDTRKDAGSGADPVDVSEPLTGLKPATTYHYRLVADGPGGTVPGADRTFTTNALPPAPKPQEPDPPKQPDPDPPKEPEPDPPTEPDTDPPVTKSRVPAQTLARVLRRGLQVRFRADEPGKLTTRVYVAGRTLGLRGSEARRRITVGKVTKRLVAGRTYTIAVKLNSRARRAARLRSAVRFTLESVMTDEAGNTTRKLRSSAVVRKTSR